MLHQLLHQKLQIKDKSISEIKKTSKILKGITIINKALIIALKKLKK